MIVSFRDTIPEQYKDQVLPYMNGMILNGIASSKQSQGLTQQAEYVQSKLPAKAEEKSSFEVPVETLKKYTGEYELNGGVIKIVLKDDKTLNLVSPNGPPMELSPISKDKFKVKFMEGFSVGFTLNEKDEAIEMIFTSPGGEMKASRKK
jgi:hypothetical protein